MTPPVALTIGGTDPTGCGGLAADLKTFAAHDIHVLAVVACASVPTEMYALPHTVVAGQLSAALAHARPVAVKVAALGSADNAAAVAARARAGDLPNLVLDPVLDAAAGHRQGLIAAMLGLIPYATVVTPNVYEASQLVGWPVKTTSDMAGAAAKLAAQGARFVVITGGALARDESIDAMWTPGGVRFLHAPRISTDNDLGRGSTFSAAVASQLALGRPAEAAITAAKEFVSQALIGASDWHIGYHGGPLDHFAFARRHTSTSATSATNPSAPRSSVPTQPSAPLPDAPLPDGPLPDAPPPATAATRVRERQHRAAA